MTFDDDLWWGPLMMIFDEDLWWWPLMRTFQLTSDVCFRWPPVAPRALCSHVVPTGNWPGIVVSSIQKCKILIKLYDWAPRWHVEYSLKCMYSHETLHNLLVKFEPLVSFVTLCDLLPERTIPLYCSNMRWCSKMDAKFLTTFSNAFSWMTICKFRLRFHWSLFPVVKLAIQWNLSIKATQDGGLLKEVACHGGKINMICKEWCGEMGGGTKFWKFVRLSWPFQRGSTVSQHWFI